MEKYHGPVHGPQKGDKKETVSDDELEMEIRRAKERLAQITQNGKLTPDKNLGKIKAAAKELSEWVTAEEKRLQLIYPSLKLKICYNYSTDTHNCELLNLIPKFGHATDLINITRRIENLNSILLNEYGESFNYNTLRKDGVHEFIVSGYNVLNPKIYSY